LVQKDPPKNYFFEKNSNFLYFFSPEALSNSSKFKYRKTEEKIDREVQKSIFLKILQKSYF
jgi:hypothetical protein